LLYVGNGLVFVIPSCLFLTGKAPRTRKKYLKNQQSRVYRFIQILNRGVLVSLTMGNFLYSSGIFLASENSFGIRNRKRVLGDSLRNESTLLRLTIICRLIRKNNAGSSNTSNSLSE